MRAATVSTADPHRLASRGALLLACAASALAAPVAAQTAPVLPDGGRVAAGDVTIGPVSRGSLSISQSSPTGIVDWNGFSIGAGGTVRFENGQGATLNRVDGAQASRLDGSLLASGSVYLINPNGVIVGRTGVVQVGGSFVATTLAITDAEFQAGGDRTFSGPSTAGVVNLGRIGALGGDVALFATVVRNEGSIAATGGTAALAAGSSVLIRDSELDGGRFVVLVGGRATSVANTGAIAATVAELRVAAGSVYALAGNISGVVAADRVTGDNGHVFLTAGAGGAVHVGATTITSGTPSYGGTVDISGDAVDIARGATIDVSAGSVGGQVYLKADRTLALAGTVLARGADQGGVLWTFAGSVDAAGATVDTRGAAVGDWIINQPTLTVDARLAGEIGRYLRTTNLELWANPADFGGDAAQGDLTIASPIALSGSDRLTLLAANTLRVDQNVTVGDAGVLNLYASGANAIGDPIIFAANRSITFTGPAHGGQALSINDDPYALIYGVADLQAMAADPAGHYAIARSFAAGATPLPGAVVGGQDGDAFSGVFEGLGHGINGLRIDAPGRSLVGLFGRVSGVIRNVGLIGGSVVGGTGVGALVASLDGGSVLRVDSSVSVDARGAPNPQAVGGLVGSSYLGLIAASTTSGAVTAAGGTGVGGLIGSGYGLSILDSAATGAVSGGDQTGGLAGILSRSGVDGSTASGSVSGRGAVGGLVGVLAFGGIGASRSSGRVLGATDVGGLVGQSLSSVFTDVEARGSVNGTLGAGENVGGLIGRSEDDSIARAVARNTVRGRTDVGGLIGRRRGGTSEGASATGPVSGMRNVGPLIGLDEPAP
ncbi:two-partner secretion domain-containing protein [Sphingomonas bacterium]|uniref:two-partner secretion domain-containing protein n=1 Tax=Sphingomonas bacterium TaxID=1895847 RepID=UPI001575C9B3|nr:filamentous hemagglutinin N-terminal domain-containing protein [Sphingomonas bacterium]